MAATRKPLQFLLGRVSRTVRRSYGAVAEGSSSSSSSSSNQLINLEYEYSAHKLVPFTPLLLCCIWFHPILNLSLLQAIQPLFLFYLGFCFWVLVCWSQTYLLSLVIMFCVFGFDFLASSFCLWLIFPVRMIVYVDPIDYINEFLARNF